MLHVASHDDDTHAANSLIPVLPTTSSALDEYPEVVGCEPVSVGSVPNVSSRLVSSHLVTSTSTVEFEILEDVENKAGRQADIDDQYDRKALRHFHIVVVVCSQTDRSEGG